MGKDTMSNLPPLNVIKNKFYFGIGGLGDFLLLMSTFYDDVQNNTDVIFVCNNIPAIREMSKIFPNINRFWFYPNKSFYPNSTTWDDIITNKLFLGSGVTPKKFNYIGDWVECGKSNVFDYYGVNAPVNWIISHKTIYPKRICIQPCGGKDGNRISRIPKSYIKKIIEKFHPKFDICLIGSAMDEIEYGGTITIDDDLWGAKWIRHDFDLQINYILGCEFLIGVNSWCKTYAALAGIKTYVYASTYKISPQEAYGWKQDPADHVFLDGYGFLDALELLND